MSEFILKEEIPLYNDYFSPEWQIYMEEKIATMVFDNTTTDEEVANQLGKDILKTVLFKFRKDLFHIEPANPDAVMVCSGCGSENVETLDWIDVQTNKVTGTYESEDPGSNWCRDCEQHLPIVQRKEFVAEGDETEECEECGATIPVVDGGTLENKHHEKSCSLFDPTEE